jgi:S1-C subfamily serine protease
MKIFLELTLSVILLLASLYIEAKADESWDEVRSSGLLPDHKYAVSSGTGFFIAPRYVVTNAHVVPSCINIAMRGAISPSAAKVVAIDHDIDLALLYTDAIPNRTATLRANNNLNIKDPLFVVGYPLAHADSGTYVVGNASVESFDGDQQDPRFIEFTAVVEKGNSGGPLIDASGNVAGVVQGRKSYYYGDNNGNKLDQNEKPFQVHGVAIGLSTLKNFLQLNNIQYASNTTYDIFVNYQPDNLAKEYVVNIHCIQF